jgi:hypothetical protein
MNRLRDGLSQHNEYIFMYNVICKRMLPYNHFAFFYFQIYLNFLLEVLATSRVTSPVPIAISMVITRDTSR